ncbi:NAD-P-binding protein [Rhizodiscina lignyota]|uniref:NAD-P-binding protein n=1 Tax=Rhizodiscina lignyota TaxID=1504668 RepID=A0A9P4I4M0_9PEZI|nr:NAD-P-binding protein [Rhizodiscina lignyota]
MKESAWSFTREKHNDTYPLINPANIDHSSHRVFITGASKAIGRAIALSYAKAGAKVIGVCARSDISNLEKEIKDAAKQSGKQVPEVFAESLDITDRKAVEAAAKSFGEKYGHLDILINNAGYLPAYALHGDFDPDDWWQGWEVNVKGTFLVTRSFLPLLFKSPTKTLINLCSSTAFHPASGCSGYCLTKFVNIRTTELLVNDYGDKGLLSYAVHPGAIVSDMSLKLPEVIQHYLMDTDELPADTIVWLTAERREWLAGRYVDATWDMEEFMSMKELVVDKELLKIRLTVPE